MTIEKLDLSSPDLVQGNIEKIQALFPNVVTEGPDGLLIDFDALRQELSDTIVEGPQERYRLDWPGKRAAMLAANTPISKTLRPVRKESVDFDTTQNLFIEGDNLDALKLLQDSYLGKVKMIYIDPPYNTGKDFIYKDNFTQDKGEYLEESGQLDEDGGRLVANLESNGRYHSDWLSMMYPRLKLARNLLRDDGVIFISIDHNEVDTLQNLVCEIFGSQNFIGHIAVISNFKGRSDDKYFATGHNYVLAISKGEFESLGVSLPVEYLADYDKTDESGKKYRTQGLRKRGSASKRSDRPKMFYPFFVNPVDGSLSLSKTDTHNIEIFPKLSSGEDGRWRWGNDTALKKLHLLIGDTVGKEKRWDVFQLDYAENDEGLKRVTPKSFWIGSEFANEAGTLELKKLFGESVFDTPKPVGLLKYIIEQSSHDGIIVDFFAGSAAFAQAMFEANLENSRSNQFILVQLPEQASTDSSAFKAGFQTIAEVSKERIRLAGKTILEDNPDQVDELDVGFRVLKIDSSNMKDVHADPRELKQGELLDSVSHIKPDRSGEDLLFQVMLNQGIELSQSITRETAEGKTVYIVGQDNLIACFDDNITDDVVKDIASRKPLYAIFRDESFREPADKINAAQIFKQLTEGHTRMKVI